MMYNQEELMEKAVKLIADKTQHKHYQRTVDIAKLNRQFLTGQGQAELVVSYKQRESEEQKQQRVHITSTRTPYVTGKVLAEFKKMDRVDNVVDQVKPLDKEVDGLKDFNDALEKFSGKQDIKEYLDQAFRFLTFHDPNAYIVLEIGEYEQGEKPYCYPVEFYSDQIYNMEYKRGELVLLHTCVERTRKNIKTGKDKSFKRHTFWAADVAVVYEEHEDGYEVPNGDLVKIEVGGKEETYYMTEANHMSGQVPAICVGYLPDPETNRETYVTPLYRAEDILKDIINTKSEKDLYRALHGFIQKWAYGVPCDYNNAGQRCISGNLTTGGTCPKCDGRGYIEHTTIQDIIYIPKPDKEEHIPLSEMVYYEEIPEYYNKSLKEDLQELEQDVQKAVFNSDLHDRSEVQLTATEINYQSDNKQNVLSEYGAQYSTIRVFLTKQYAHHHQLKDKVVIEHKFPQDLQLESVAELLAQRKAMIDSGAPNFMIEKIDYAIARKQNIDDPEFVERLRIRESFRPFRHKSQDDRLYVLGGLPETNRERILWTFFDEIMAEVIAANDNFYEVPREKQLEWIDEVIEKYRQASGIRNALVE